MMIPWIATYLVIGFVIWYRFTPAPHKREWALTPFRVVLWPAIVVMGVARAMRLIKEARS